MTTLNHRSRVPRFLPLFSLAGLTKDDVANTRTWAQMKELIGK
jgi:hypothetical protein